jgi:2-C-methyl-D-erythritol 4-phosphate cytidylyltransferase
MKVSAIIPAAGSGRRFGEAKQFKLLAGRPLLFHSMKPFLESSIIQEVIVVVPDYQIDTVHNDLLSISAGKPLKVIAGGTRRQDSVKNGVTATVSSTTMVCIHDAVRPFVSETLINNSIAACKTADGAVVALRSVDTVKLSEHGIVKETLNREKIWLVQTPQTFRKDKLIQALDHADEKSLIATDESYLMEAMGFSVALVQGEINNFKITTMDDWKRAEYLI